MTITKQKKFGFLAAIRDVATLCAVALVTIFVSVSDAGIGRTGIAVGRITQFGSIFVNDREYTIDAGTAISIEGQSATEGELRLGQVVIVKGMQDDTDSVGLANSVLFADNVEGPIANINIDDGQLAVLGQSILVDEATIVATLSGGNSLDDLSAGDQVEVSGFLTVDRQIVASLIQQKSAGSLEVTGVVSDLTTGTFTINALTIDYSRAALVDATGSPLGSIAEGDIVEAQGVTFGVNGELTALRVQLQPKLSIVEGTLGEFEGLVTRFDSATDFSVGAVSVLTSNSTLFIGGGPANLTENTSVEVLGQFDANGILIADQVTIRGTRIRVHAAVDAVAETSLTVLGIVANVDSSTRLTDGSSAGLKPFALSDLNPADFVELRSFKNPAAITPFLAERMVRNDPQSEVRLQGFVDVASTSHFMVHGVAIDVDQQTSFSDAGGDDISATEFFGRLTVGTFVSVQGTRIAVTGLLAENIELGLDD